jgi:Protein of unknown function (DUF4230)
LLRAAPSSSTGREAFQDCSGGNSRPSRPFGRGGRYFLLMTAPPSFSRHFNWTLAFTVIGLSAIAAAVFVFNRCASLPGRTTKETVDQMERVGRDLRDAIVQITQLQPRVTVNNRVYFEQTSPIAELALISQKLDVEHEFLHTWAGSTKRLRLHGTYTAKAGFDLRQEFSVTVTPEATIVRLPHAQILGVEQNAIELLAYENGFWNPISGADVQAELATLGKLARDRAAAQNLSAEAEESFRTQLKGRVGDTPPVQVIFYPPPRSE